MKIYADIKNDSFTFEQNEKNGNRILKRKGEEQTYSFLHLDNNRYSLINNDKSFLIHIVREGGLYHVHIEGAYFPIHVEDERSRTLRQLVQKASLAGGEQRIRAPIPGMITKIMVRKGENIKKGDALIILEAMKMENEIRSDIDGTVQAVLVSQGSAVEKDQELLIIQ
jgi:biotin carboxyl carrier protein